MMKKRERERGKQKPFDVYERMKRMWNYVDKRHHRHKHRHGLKGSHVMKGSLSDYQKSVNAKKGIDKGVIVEKKKTR